MERVIRKVKAFNILSELFPCLTKANKATPRLKMINKRIDTIAILNTVIYSRLVWKV